MSKAISMLRIVLEGWPGPGAPRQVEHLAGRLEAERPCREASKRAAPLRRCALPAPKAFDGHGWSTVPWPEGMGRESLLALDFVERREDLVLMGDVGTGKTRMASALCALACERRLEARLFAASSLVMRMGAPATTGSPTGRPHSSAGPACPSSTGSGFSRPPRTGRGRSSRSSPTPTRRSRW